MRLLIDHYDSFTSNLAQYFGDLGCELLDRPNDTLWLKSIGALSAEAICFSREACTPCELLDSCRTAMAQVTPALVVFIELAKQGNVIPVLAEFIAGGETPVLAFKKLDRGGYSFLFESTEKNDVSGRFSFVGVDARVVLQSYGREVRIIEDGNQRRLETSGDPLDEVRKLMARYQFVSRPELPRFAGGAVGFIGYEAIHFFQPKVPLAKKDELQLPEALFMIPIALVVFD